MDKTFGQIISDACADHDVSHAELARRLGVKKPRVPAILRGENMTEKLFRRCVQALGLELHIDLYEQT